MNFKIDLTGKRFGMITVVSYSHTTPRVGSFWNCVCDCGNRKVMRGVNLNKGHSRSCGCLVGKVARSFHAKPHKVIDGVECKECSICLKHKPLSSFTKSKDRWDGLEGRCKECERDRKAKESRESKNSRWKLRYHSTYKHDINFVIKRNLSLRVRKVLKGINKSKSTMDLVGCSLSFLKSYIESMFDENMSWENYGSYWHIDHRVPCASFDLSDPEQQRSCFHYTNLQPMFWRDNLSKRDKIL